MQGKQGSRPERTRRNRGDGCLASFHNEKEVEAEATKRKEDLLLGSSRMSCMHAATPPVSGLGGGIFQKASKHCFQQFTQLQTTA